MKRYNKLMITVDKEYKQNKKLVKYLKENKHEISETLCPQTDNITIWFEDDYSPNIVKIPNINIVKNLKVWHIHRKKEILLTEDNYKDFKLNRFWKKIYRKRTGKYDKLSKEIKEAFKQGHINNNLLKNRTMKNKTLILQSVLFLLIIAGAIIAGTTEDKTIEIITYIIILILGISIVFTFYKGLKKK